MTESFDEGTIMKKSRAGLLVAGFAFGLSVLAAGAVPVRATDLVTAATQEGSVTVYLQPGFKDGLQPALDQWANLYPKISVNLLEMPGPPAVERIRTEQTAHNALADVIAVGDGAVYQAAKDGLLASYDRANMTNAAKIVPRLRQFVDPNHLWMPLSVAVFGIVINTDKISAADAPKSWKDLINPKYAGKLGMLDFTIAGGGNALMTLGEPVLGKGYFETLLRERKPTIYGSTAELAAIVARGEKALVAPSRMPATFDLQDAPVKFIIPSDGLVLSIIQGAIVKDAPHPHAAQLFLNFLLSPLAQKGLASRGSAPVIAGVPDALDLTKTPFLSTGAMGPETLARQAEARALAKSLAGH
jgi:iron(III) transport system substrate-binding protein